MLQPILSLTNQSLYVLNKISNPLVTVLNWQMALDQPDLCNSRYSQSLGAEFRRKIQRGQPGKCIIYPVISTRYFFCPGSNRERSYCEFQPTLCGTCCSKWYYFLTFANQENCTISIMLLTELTINTVYTSGT